MSFILVPRVGEDIKINAWNWRPTVAFLHAEGVIDASLAERLTIHGMRAPVSEELALRMGAVIGRRLEGMRPGERIRGDLTTTNEPKIPARFDRPETINAVEVYSATYEWLLQFKGFCERCGGFFVS